MSGIESWNKCCELAEELLKNDKQEDYSWLLLTCPGNGRKDLLPLKEKLWSDIMDRETFQLRSNSYRRGLCSKIFKPIIL